MIPAIHIGCRLFAICYRLFAICYWLSAIGYPANAADALQIPAVTQPARNYYFAATAQSTNGLESDYSNEVTTTNPRPTLIWDPSQTSATYHLYRGTNTRSYTTTWSAGTTCVFSVPSVPLPTNQVIEVTTLHATNLAYKPWGGTWMLANKTTLRFTNPPVGLEYRAVGRTPPTLSINKYIQ